MPNGVPNLPTSVESGASIQHNGQQMSYALPFVQGGYMQPYVTVCFF